MKFKLVSSYQPTGDQPQAIEKLTEGVRKNLPHQVLLGVTGSGKTFTLAKVVEKTQRPALIISHNKTLAAQLFQEIKEFFPQNAVGFFISYYDYYLPESYIPQTDTYIAKETEINEEIDKLRLEATSFLFSRSDVIIVASVSCIYNIGSPKEYEKNVFQIRQGLQITPKEFFRKLVDLRYLANRWELKRGEFRRRGERVEIYPAYFHDVILEVVFAEGRISELFLKSVFGERDKKITEFFLFPAKHYLTDETVTKPAFGQIRKDLKIRLDELKREGKLVEAQRLEQRVEYDLEMIDEVGYVSGIENYSRYFDNRRVGDPPFTLVDYFREAYGNNFLTIVDESHITVPQLRGMYRGDKSRKQTLVDFGFRLPSCLDNRPLKFTEFLALTPQIIYDSATPKIWEIDKAKGKVVEQLVRPTGLTEPLVKIRQAKSQVRDLVLEIIKRKKQNQRVLVTTLTKRLAEDLAEFLSDSKNTNGEVLKVQYLHADIKALERNRILADLRGGTYDVIVGINLLREGLDLPEVSLVAIMDADAFGFLRSATSLIQTMGRAARNSAGEVIMYADKITPAMQEALVEVKRRRKIQTDFNLKHNITPQTIIKPIRPAIFIAPKKERQIAIDPSSLTPKELRLEIKKLKRKMNHLAAALEFEQAAKVRDEIKSLEEWGE